MTLRNDYGSIQKLDLLRELVIEALPNAIMFLLLLLLNNFIVLNFFNHVIIQYWTSNEKTPKQKCNNDWFIADIQLKNPY